MDYSFIFCVGSYNEAGTHIKKLNTMSNWFHYGQSSENTETQDHIITLFKI